MGLRGGSEKDRSMHIISNPFFIVDDEGIEIEVSISVCVLDRQAYMTILIVRNVTSGEHVAVYNTLSLSGDGGL